MRLAVLGLLALAQVVSAQAPPYDVFPEAEPPYFRVRYEASSTPGELSMPVNYTVWIPSGVEKLRGVVVHQHGCGEGSAKSGLTGAFDVHWQALAKKHDSALLAASYEQPADVDCRLWSDPRNGSDAAFRRSLADLGQASGHPELASAPWALWGHSGGGFWVGIMTLLHPKRTAATWMLSGSPLLTPIPDRPTLKTVTLPPEPPTVPMMLSLGTKEGVTVKEGRFAMVWPAMERFFRATRPKGYLIGVAVDPLTSHEAGNQRYMAIPWLDACLTDRLPDRAGDPLRSMPADAAWLAPLLGDTAVPASDYSGDPAEAMWLPNEQVAQAWMHYVRDTKVPDTTPPPAPTNVQVDGGVVTWEAEADPESGIAYFVIERDGEEIATVPENPENRFGRPLFQGLQYSDTPLQPRAEMRFVDKAGADGRYRVVAVNTAGLRSR